MATGDCYAVKLNQTYLGQAVLNVWTYEQISGAANLAVGLWTNFQTIVLPAIKALQIDEVIYDDLEVFNIEFGSDYYSGDIADTGDRVTTEPAPSFIAMGFKSNRNGFGSRRSYKRFCGFNDEDFDGNAWNATPYSLGVALNGVMDDVINYGAAAWKPVQLRSGWSPGVTPTKNFDITNWATDTRVTTQNSRKPGR